MSNQTIAAKFMAISELFLALSQDFRNEGDSANETGGDDAVVKKPAAKSKPVSKPAKAELAHGDQEFTEDDCRTALKELSKTHGSAVMARALEKVGAAKLSDVDESEYGTLMKHICGLSATKATLDEGDEEKPAKPAAKKAKAKAVTFDQVTEVFQKLVREDRDAAVKLLGKYEAKKVSGVPEDSWADFIADVNKALEGDDTDELMA